ncbi:hypothetical protein SAMN05216383_12618 [Prevotella sp. KH2C16]|nr:hypothetical protein SAMN05216383_12618 [Prevotella sp. KH2C16]
MRYIKTRWIYRQLATSNFAFFYLSFFLYVLYDFLDYPFLFHACCVTVIIQFVITLRLIIRNLKTHDKHKRTRFIGYGICIAWCISAYIGYIRWLLDLPFKSPF